jgi:hypothetical protein
VTELTSPAQLAQGGTETAVATSASLFESTFPDQHDQDGDGLLNEVYGGVDPDDTQFDSDGDGLSDYYEISYGYDPEDADSDNDGLTDSEEAFIYYTDPTMADTDGDTLSDYLEAKQGWLVSSTAANGATQVTRVWSNPFATDNDSDDLDDLKEFVFGFHPEVQTDANAIQNIVQFDDIQVQETDTPLLFLQMEAEEGASVFLDGSGERNNATCDWTLDSCPAASVTGYYGDGLEFDGTDDYLTIDHFIDPSTTEFTAALWFKSYSNTGMYQRIIAQEPDSGTGLTYVDAGYSIVGMQLDD